MAAQYINIISTQSKHHQNVDIEGLNGLLGLHLQLSIHFFCKGFFRDLDNVASVNSSFH